MKKLTKKEVSELILEMTIQYTDLYCEFHKTDYFDKELWAALHIGFIAGMKQNGYTEKFLHGCLDLAQEKLSKIINKK